MAVNNDRLLSRRVKWTAGLSGIGAMGGGAASSVLTNLYADRASIRSAVQSAGKSPAWQLTAKPAFYGSIPGLTTLFLSLVWGLVAGRSRRAAQKALALRKTAETQRKEPVVHGADFAQGHALAQARAEGLLNAALAPTEDAPTTPEPGTKDGFPHIAAQYKLTGPNIFDVEFIEIGGYKITGTLGRGGQCRVLLGEKNILGGTKQEVAIRVFQKPEDPETLVRIKKEIVALYELKGKNNTENILDYGENSGAIFTISEYAGIDLKKYLSQMPGGTLPLETAKIIIKECVKALKYASKKIPGVVHRDIKPENILINEVCHADGTNAIEVTVGDWGILSGLDLMGKATQTGMWQGTAGYASPEQMKGDKLDFKSDLFSLARVLYVLLTGQKGISKEEERDGQSLYRAYIEFSEGKRIDLSAIHFEDPASSKKLKDFFIRAFKITPAARFDTWEEFERSLEYIY